RPAAAGSPGAAEQPHSSRAAPQQAASPGAAEPPRSRRAAQEQLSSHGAAAPPYLPCLVSTVQLSL
ncbi:unnamed protein product, partial [Closterium sp. NIES-54]